MGTRRRKDVDATSLRRIDVVTTSCACWEFAPPPPPQKKKNSKPWPPNILNLPTPMYLMKNGTVMGFRGYRFFFHRKVLLTSIRCWELLRPILGGKNAYNTQGSTVNESSNIISIPMSFRPQILYFKLC